MKADLINNMHEHLNDAFADLHGIHVCDEDSRDSKQSAILSLISLRKDMEALGLKHTMPRHAGGAR